MTSINEAINNDISSLLLNLEEKGVDIIQPNYIAAEIEKEYGKVDSKHQYLSIMKLRDMVRRYLAKKLDPVEKSKDSIEDMNGDFFGGALQGYYPTKREDECVYIQRELMTNEEIDHVITNMQKASDGLVDHIDALKAWKISREAA